MKVLLLFIFCLVWLLPTPLLAGDSATTIFSLEVRAEARQITADESLTELTRLLQNGVFESEVTVPIELKVSENSETNIAATASGSLKNGIALSIF